MKFKLAAFILFLCNLVPVASNKPREWQYIHAYSDSGGSSGEETDSFQAARKINSLSQVVLRTSNGVTVVSMLDLPLASSVT